jgi:hypothetical protein
MPSPTKLSSIRANANYVVRYVRTGIYIRWLRSRGGKQMWARARSRARVQKEMEDFGIIPINRKRPRQSWRLPGI